MKRFCRDSTVVNLDKPDLLSDMFKKNISENHKFKCTERDFKRYVTNQNSIIM